MLVDALYGALEDLASTCLWALIRLPDVTLKAQHLAGSALIESPREERPRTSRREANVCVQGSELQIGVHILLAARKGTYILEGTYGTLNEELRDLEGLLRR